ncbi:hypothetical protein MsAm2_07950 [Methanolapillus ohkumae]|uniref:Type II secretion system protein GspF domain-containing protein n=2 Tax=Methanolapillus ohkumae TaxID=3028298 RepID=A0AA96V6Y2_9EURY|nr:hypothetical protein MsAm2_07950 [Methanosarcinaceae archaeon Am2]
MPSSPSFQLFEKKAAESRLFISVPMYFSLVFSASSLLFIFCTLWAFVLFLILFFQRNESFGINFGSALDNPFKLLLLPFLIFAGLECLILVFAFLLPFLLSAEKKIQIENQLPFAVNYMSAMASAGIPPEFIFQSLFEKKMKNVYDAIAFEFMILECHLHLLGKDLPSALQYLSDTTPSPLLSEFLTGAKNTIVSGSDFQVFVLSKKQEYQSLFLRKKDQFFQMLDLLSEIYMTIFLAAPVFFIILLFTIAPLSGPKTEEMKFLVYQAVPFLGLFFLFFLEVIDPKENR